MLLNYSQQQLLTFLNSSVYFIKIQEKLFGGEVILHEIYILGNFSLETHFWHAIVDKKTIKHSDIPQDFKITFISGIWTKLHVVMLYQRTCPEIFVLLKFHTVYSIFTVFTV